MNMPGLAGFRTPDMDGSRIAVEVLHTEPRKLPIPASSVQRGLDQIAKTFRACVHQSLGLGNLEILDPRSIDFPEWGDAPPRLVVVHRRFVITPCAIECRLKHRERSV